MHRERKTPKPYNNYVALLYDIIDKEPSNYEEATEKKEWKDAMIEEYQSIMKNDVWETVPRPKKKYVMTSKWIYKINHVVDGSLKNYKEIFVAQGLAHKEGINYKDTFSPISRYTYIRYILALVEIMRWKIK